MTHRTITKSAVSSFSPFSWWLPACLLALAGGPAAAADFYLAAQPFTATMPDGVAVPMWGFAACDATFTTCGPTSSPGPTLRIPDGEPTPVVLNLHVRNQLPAATSLYLPAQLAALSPVEFTDDQGRQRVRSFTTETASGTDGVYRWSDLRPGTYLYHSGTQPQVQVQMGLLGALIYDPAPGEAYPGVAYDAEALILYSEIDTALHAAVQDGSYGTAAYPSTYPYKPSYFLVNGAPYVSGQAPLDGGVVGERLLLRLINAGLTHRAPHLLGGHFSVIAEEGQPLPFASERYGTLVPAGGTKDAILVPTQAGSYPLYDRMLNLTTRDVSGGGSYAFLAVAPPALPADAPIPFAAWPSGAPSGAPSATIDPVAAAPAAPDQVGLEATTDGGFACSSGAPGAPELPLVLLLAATALVLRRRRVHQRHL